MKFFKYGKEIQSILCILMFLITKAMCLNVTFQEFLQSTPNTFGLLTVTHARNGIFSYFRRHIDNYAKMECPEMTQISVVWNNNQTPQSVGFVQEQSWKRPVYFMKTPYNSMDFRYMLPEKSKAKVFFQIDDDFLISCEELKRGFEQWRLQAIGDIGPIITYAPRGYDYDAKMQKYEYKDPLKAEFYSVNLVGVAWISRFFFQLYNSQKLWQILQMRKIVRQKNNCDDIALNFLMSYFFPQLIPMSIGRQIKSLVHPASQGLTKTHYSYRTECLIQFTEILGYNTLRFIVKNQQTKDKRYKSQSKKYVVYLKKKQLSYKFLQNQPIKKQMQIHPSVMDMWQKSLNQDIKKQQKSASFSSLTQNKDQKQILERELKALKQQYNKNSFQLNKVLDQFRRVEQKAGNNGKDNTKIEIQPSIKSQYDGIKAKNRKLSRLQQSLNFIKTISVLAIIFVFGMFIYLVSDCAQICSEKQSISKRNKRGILPQQDSQSNSSDQS